jgi:hypothetical protein
VPVRELGSHLATITVLLRYTNTTHVMTEAWTAAKKEFLVIGTRIGRRRYSKEAI